MADTKITALTALTAADPANDVLPIVDVSDTTMAASGTTKKISVNNILGASGTATLASATITGDLTVDTSTLKVDSANNRVGIGTASPAYPLDLDSTLGTVLNINSTNANGPGLRFSRSGTVNGYVGSAKYTVGGALADFSIDVAGANNLIFGVNDVEAMRLNSTGLGVGGSPTRKLSIVGSGNTYANINSGDNTSLVGVLFGGSSAPSNGQIIYNNTDNSMGLHTAGAVKLTIDSSGNVGIGVTPSATNSTYFQALEIARVGQGLTAAKNALTSSPSSFLSNNSYATYSAGTVWNYAVSQPAAQYRLVDGAHSWHTAASGTAGNAITFTQAMTLESTGSLVLGAAAVATTATDGFLYIPSCAGAPTGVPTAKTGRVPMVVDSTNNRFYVYVSGAWKFAALI